jgi:hypothetical protein
MPYTAPSGWVETREAAEDVAVRSKFHRRHDCPAISEPHLLREVDRPYSAARCKQCAPA